MFLKTMVQIALCWDHLSKVICSCFFFSSTLPIINAFKSIRLKWGYDMEGRWALFNSAYTIFRHVAIVNKAKIVKIFCSVMRLVIRLVYRRHYATGESIKINEWVIPLSSSQPMKSNFLLRWTKYERHTKTHSFLKKSSQSSIKSLSILFR